MLKPAIIKLLIPLIAIGFLSVKLIANPKRINDLEIATEQITNNLSSPTLAFKIFSEVLDTTQTDSTRIKLAELAYRIGQRYYVLCNYRYAEMFLVKGAQTFQQQNDTINLAWTLHQLALTQKYWGHYRDALGSVQRATNLFELEKNELGIAYAQMVEVYINKAWGHFDRIEGKCREALNRHRSLGNIGGEAYCLLALGNFHLEYSRLDSAWHYYTKTLDLFESINNHYGKALCKRDMGRYWLKREDFDNALKNFNESLEIHKQRDSKRGISELEALIGYLYIEKGDFRKAIVHLEIGQELAVEIEVSEEVVKNFRLLATAYEKAGQQSKAISSLNSYIELRDSLFNAEKHFQIVALQTQYETEKKLQQIALQKVRLEKNTAELSRKNLFILFLATGLVLFFALSFVVFQLYRTKRRDNELLSKQKMVIEQKNQQITDSINYAQRIQNAVLSSEDELKILFPESFILYIPKDIVSGDFFYFREFDNKICVAAADCTGHGVPGAFMSMLGTTLMSEIIGRDTPNSAAAILETLRFKAKEALHQSSYKSETKDGMEMGLCLYDKSKKTLQFAGAGRPLYRIRNGNLTHIKGTKSPIGVFIKEFAFENNDVDIVNGDTIYLFSDGFADQVGGENRVKLKQLAFKQLLIDNSHHPLVEQKVILESFISNYMKGWEQIDDILVIGFRV